MNSQKEFNQLMDNYILRHPEVKELQNTLVVDSLSSLEEQMERILLEKALQQQKHMNEQKDQERANYVTPHPDMCGKQEPQPQPRHSIMEASNYITRPVDRTTHVRIVNGFVTALNLKEQNSVEQDNLLAEKDRQLQELTKGIQSKRAQINEQFRDLEVKNAQIKGQAENITKLLKEKQEAQLALVKELARVAYWKGRAKKLSSKQ